MHFRYEIKYTISVECFRIENCVSLSMIVHLQFINSKYV